MTKVFSWLCNFIPFLRKNSGFLVLQCTILIFDDQNIQYNLFDSDTT